MTNRSDAQTETVESAPDAKPTDEQLAEIRREVAQEYHRVIMDLALHGEARTGNRRFWHDAQKLVHYEDLPEQESDDQSTN